MSQIGKSIIDFEVQAYQNEKFETLNKENVTGKWSIFFFYPADFTFICPTELEDLAGKYAEIKSSGAEVYAVSTDTHFVHKAWHDASDTIKKIKFPMLGDPNAKLSKGFKVYNKSTGLAERGTFIVNPQGEIAHYEVVAGNVGRNADELVRKLKALQFVSENPSEVCPAKWEAGEKTLEPSIDLVGMI